MRRNTSETRRDPRATRRAIWKRGFWMAMAAVHLPALFACWNALFSASVTATPLDKFLLLGLSVLFFGLKALDLRCMRCDARTWRSKVTILLAVLFLHVNVLSPQVVEDGGSREIPMAAAFVLLSTQAPVLRRVLQAIADGVLPRVPSFDGEVRIAPLSPDPLLCRIDPSRLLSPRPPPFVG